MVFTFKIKAVAEGGNNIFRDVEVRLEVCKYEVVTSLDTTLLFIEQYIDEQIDLDTPLSPMFSTNDTDCPANQFKLKQDSWTGSWDTEDITLPDFAIVN